MFVTAADDIAGLNPAQLADRLTIRGIEVQTPAAVRALRIFELEP